MGQQTRLTWIAVAACALLACGGDDPATTDTDAGGGDTGADVVDTSDTAPPVQVQLVDRIRRILHLVVENRALTTILVREAVGLDAEVDAKMREFYQSLHFYLRDALENGKTMGILRDLDTEVAAFCVLGTIKQLMEQLVMSEDGKLAEDVDRVALGVLDFNLRGLIGR